MRLKLGTAFLACVLLTTGCWDRQEMNDRAIILGWGMDLNGDGRYVATANIVVPGGTKSGRDRGREKPISHRDRLWHERRRCRSKYAKKAAPRHFASHRRNVFIGEALARNGIADVLDEYARNPLVRLRTNIFVVKGGTAQEAMSLGSRLEKNPTISVQKIQEVMGAPVSRSLLDFFIMANGASGGSVIPIVEIVSPAQTAKKGEDTDNAAGSELALTGSAVFDRNLKLKGYLGYDNFWVRLWITQKLDHRVFTIRMGKERETVTIPAMRFKSRIVPKINGEEVSFTVWLSGEGEINENNANLDLSKPDNVKKVEDELNRRLTEKVEQTVALVQKQYRADIFELGETLHRKHPYVWKRMKKDWDRRFVNADIEFRVHMKISGHGAYGKIPGSRRGGQG
ncbi:spore germination protein KC [Paenibacillus macerans]|nr:spore germination protein KC [Paenibacillus macerans]